MAEYFTQKCAICEKEIVTHGAKNWGYKYKQPKGPYVFFCSYKHQRQWEAKHAEKPVDVIAQAAAEEAKKPKKIPQDRGVAAKKMAKEIQAGRDPIKWMAKNGYKNPYQAYDAVRHYCETKMPEMLEVLRPIKELRKAEVQKVEKVPEINKQEEKVEVLDAEVKPIGGTFRYQITGIETDFGRFTMGTVAGVLRFDSPGNVEISMVTEDWLKMAKELPEILAVLGVAK